VFGQRVKHCSRAHVELDLSISKLFYGHNPPTGRPFPLRILRPLGVLPAVIRHSRSRLAAAVPPSRRQFPKSNRFDSVTDNRWTCSTDPRLCEMQLASSTPSRAHGRGMSSPSTVQHIGSPLRLRARLAERCPSEGLAGCFSPQARRPGLWPGRCRRWRSHPLGVFSCQVLQERVRIRCFDRAVLRWRVFLPFLLPIAERVASSSLQTTRPSRTPFWPPTRPTS
jgi:hypothetical protein